MQSRLFDADPGLKKAASPAARRELRSLSAPVIEIEAGEFAPSGLAPPDALGILIRDGLIARTVNVPTGASVELISPGDLIQPWTVELPSFTSTSWSALQPSAGIVFTAEVTAAVARHQELLIEVTSRGIRRAHTLTVSAAIESIVGVENRLLLAMWHLAERYGRVTSEGVTIPLRLTHELLAVLIGSRRPSVTAAMASLGEQGVLISRPDRTLLLRGAPPAPVPA